MSNVPKNLRYTNDHEWLNPEGKVWTVGITDFAQRQLGDVVMVELPKQGDMVTKGQELGTMESVKAVSELYAPVSGRVMEVNPALTEDPELVNSDPYEGAWLVKIEPSDKSELDDLMTAEAYEKFLAEQAE